MTIEVSRLSTAERLLWDYGVTEPDHIDLEAIAFDHGAQVSYRPLNGCEARLVARGQRAIISVNSESNPGRRRFSLAHELAHWVCDRNTGAFLCAAEDIGPQNAEAKSSEARANAYAGQLVLPTYLVDPWIGSRPVDLSTGSLLANDFRTSLTAAAIKLVRRTTRMACVACHSQTRLKWHQRSTAFPSELFVLPELHHESDAFRLAFGGGAGISRTRREPAARWLSGRDIYRLEATTQSTRLPDGSILTMIALG